jgi:beta-lactamase class A
MRKLGPRLTILAFAFAISAASARAQQAATATSATHESSARSDIESLIQQSGGDVAVAFRALDGGQELLIHENRPFEDPLSLKIPVMIELFAQADSQQVKMNDGVPVRNLFRSAADSSAYTIDPNAGDSLIHDSGKVMTLHDLCVTMITTNSDIAANLLIERLGIEAIRSRIHALDADGMVLAADFGDAKAAQRGVKNVTTPLALMTILLALAENQVVNADASQQMVGLLAHSLLPGSLAGIASSPELAATQKPSPTGDQHDAAIIFGARSFVLVTDIRGLSPQSSSALVAKIAHLLAAAI